MISKCIIVSLLSFLKVCSENIESFSKTLLYGLAVRENSKFLFGNCPYGGIQIIRNAPKVGRSTKLCYASMENYTLS